MDNAYFEALKKLLRSAKGYMGKTWLKSVEENMDHLMREFQTLSDMNASNLETVVQAEQREKGLNDKIRELEAALELKAKGDTVIVEKKIEDEYKPDTGQVEKVVTEVKVEVIEGSQDTKQE